MGRLSCLDGSRGILALYVLLSHMAPFAWTPAAIQWLPKIFSHGGAAVDMFFILSGLVISGSLDSSAGQVRTFLMGRVTRTLPVFFVVFAAAVMLQPIATDFTAMPWVGPASHPREIWSDGWPDAWWAELLAHVTMTHGLFPNGVLPNAWVSYLGAAWSLSTEWQFYIAIALLWRVLGRRRWALAWVFFSLAIAAIAWRLSAPLDLHFSRAFLPNKAHYFALGIASGMLTVSARSLEAGSPESLNRALTTKVSSARGRHARVIAYFASLLGTCCICCAEGRIDKMGAPLTWTFVLAVQFIPTARLARFPASVLRSPPLLWLGAISYDLYLVNEPIQKALSILLGRVVAGNGPLFDLIWIPGAILLPLWAAWGLHHGIERPAIAWGRARAL